MSTPVVNLSDVSPTPPTWLWPGKIPAAGLTLLVGDADEGKSTIACDLAARLSRPQLGWPDGQRVHALGDTLFCLVEDHIESTLVPRLTAANADLDRIAACTQPEAGAITSHLCSGRFRCIVLDPFSAFFPTTAREKATRANLQALHALAQTHQVAVLAILHLTKSAGARTLHRVLGSVAMTAVPRAVLSVERLFFDDLRVLRTLKHNLAGDQEVLPYHFTTVPVAGVAVPRIVWDRPLVVRGA